MTLTVTGIDHLVLRCRDLAAMERFYTEVLGFEVARRQDRLGLVQLRAGAQLVDLVDVGGMLGQDAAGPGSGPAGRNLDHLCLNVADFDLAQVTTHLEAHGAKVGESGRRFGAKGMGVSLYLTDPEGNGLELRG
ncbi:MAG TPA: VOC family protein [Caulobacteraceae bacterium]|nr:VOC family protein [Caulobacteraceae bacterium]